MTQHFSPSHTSLDGLTLDQLYARVAIAERNLNLLRHKFQPTNRPQDRSGLSYFVRSAIEVSEAHHQRLEKAMYAAYEKEQMGQFMRVIEVLHRSPDSHVGFVRKQPDGFNQLFSLPPQQLRSGFSQIVPWLEQDAYFTVNGYYKQAPWRNTNTGLPDVMRKEINLRYLNACYVDLDIGRIGASGAKSTTLEEGAQILFDLMFSGQLPQCSVTARSGRGMYVFWILRDEDNPHVAPRGDTKFYWHHLELYKKINQALCQRLEILAADHAATDGARVLRVPGTQHGTTGALCSYSINRDEGGGLFTYTLSELAELLEVDTLLLTNAPSSRPATNLADAVAPTFVEIDEIDEAARSFEAPEQLDEPLPLEPAPMERGPMPQRANGPKALAHDRAADMEILERARGGWPKGKRRRYLNLYALFLRASGIERGLALRKVSVMAHNCQPPYPSDINDTPNTQIVEEVWRDVIKHPNTQNAVKWLRITHEEAKDLGLKTLIPESLREERDGAQPKQSSRPRQTEKRRQVLEKLIASQGMQSARDFVALLATQGIKTGQVTVNRDLQAMGLQHHPNRKKAGRKPVAP